MQKKQLKKQSDDFRISCISLKKFKMNKINSITEVNQVIKKVLWSLLVSP